MPKILEALKTERDRKSAADFNIVHMYKSGQFYTAYDWSAWIISAISYTDAVRNETRDRHPLAVTRIKMKDSDQTFCKVGFPFKSIEKFCPNHQDFEGVENDHINSYLGVLSHSSSFNIKRDLFEEMDGDWLSAA